jgi:hypothetical protein
MKKTLIIVILILSNTVFGQIPGKAFEGPVVLFDTLTIKKGDIIYLGKGSDRETGSFINLYAPKDKTVNTLYNIFSNDSDLSHKVIPQQNLDGNFAGSQLAVESFSLVSSRKKGKKILGVINMKENQFTEGKVLLQGDVFLNNVVVDFEPAIRSGEIIKISAPIFTEKVPEREILFSPFLMTTKGIAPVVVAINNLSKNELYNKTLNWTSSFYQIQNQATITSIPDEKININGITKNVKYARFMDNDVFVDLPYLFTVDFTDGEITMSFTLGDKNGNITDEYGEVIANASPSRIFDKNGEVRKMSKIFKVEAEKAMNDLSYALVDYLLK